MNPDGAHPINLTNNAVGDHEPAWSPDGSMIAFRSSRDGNAEVYTMNADGTGQVNRSQNAAIDREPDWQPIPRCTLTGTTADDVLTGGAGKDVIRGRGGDDTLVGRGGNDILRGGDENGTIRGGAQNDILNGGAETDTASHEGAVGATTPVSASLASNFATGEGANLFSYIENLTGTDGDDTLSGSMAANLLKGLGGDDVLRSEDGMSGNDTVNGGNGTNDTCLADPGDIRIDCP